MILSDLLFSSGDLVSVELLYYSSYKVNFYKRYLFCPIYATNGIQNMHIRPTMEARSPSIFPTSGYTIEIVKGKISVKVLINTF